ncbi:sugar kinase NBD/HSP70 family [Candidatus Termititenax dinenymphae]|uniref:Sugar kinase NBD/HSP70 family n=1 Tax=Candidatus Termititenax dinenymphae TaxID=2218523 RepID=A0A388TL65_9BACT|nr:sugar kinase NBD/HSP70 family [Candidatus Termititenax dinenymphae]
MYIGIDLGGTKITAGLADAAGRILQKETIKTAQNVVEQLAALILKLSAGQNILKIGLGIPGQVKNGSVINMPNVPQLNGVDLLAELKKLYPADYTIDNDANAAAVAELKYGAGKNYKNFIYVTVSTGIGGGIIIDGKLYSGANGTAGEFGHTIIVPDGPQCGCGNKGCWEALGSGTALANMAAAKLESGVETKLKELLKGGKVNAELVVEAAKLGDAVAQELLDVNGYYNAIGIANLVNTFDPEVIIVGGGLSFNGDYFFQPLLKSLKMFQLLNPEKSIEILRAGCSKDAGLLGAVALVLP